MSRSSATMSDKVLDHFMTADMDVAVEDLRIAKRIVGNRQAAETPATSAPKKRKPRAKKQTTADAKTTAKLGGMVSMAATTTK